MAQENDGKPKNMSVSRLILSLDIWLSTFRSLYDTVVKIEVGTTAKMAFDVHKGLLCHHSDYFLDRLNENSSQDSASQCTLEDENPTVFAHFFIWMYTNKLGDDDIECAPEGMSWEVLVDIYLFANRRLARRFRNACIDALILKMDNTHELAPPLLIKRIWRDIPAAMDPIRRLFVAYFGLIKGALRHSGIDEVKAYPLDLLARVAVADSPEELCLWNSRCSFHNHVEGEEFCWESYGL